MIDHVAGAAVREAGFALEAALGGLTALDPMRVPGRGSERRPEARAANARRPGSIAPHSVAMYPV